MENSDFICMVCSKSERSFLISWKKTCKLAFLFLLIPVFSFSQAAKSSQSFSGELTIPTMHNVVLPAADLNKHKHYDVEICRTDFNGSPDMYLVKYYKKEKNTLKGFEAWYEAKGDFTKASYNWKNDTLSVRLFNNNPGSEKRFKLFGKGSKSGIYRW
jgi:hypothetical protein